MDVKVINSFLVAAYDVLGKELGISAEKGRIGSHQDFFNVSDFTIRIAIKGENEGFIWYTMTEKTALAIASKMMDSPVTVMDAMAESALAELGNMISGLAATQLGNASIACTLESPIVMKGKRACMLGDATALAIPLTTPLGHLDIKVCLARVRQNA
ncbi:MAG: chemotaxis protein CheX [Nitrospirota bacterium]|nr:chemotaxis protein CheX [Nitrospirota bacterium]